MIIGGLNGMFKFGMNFLMCLIVVSVLAISLTSWADDNITANESAILNDSDLSPQNISNLTSNEINSLKPEYSDDGAFIIKSNPAFELSVNVIEPERLNVISEQDYEIFTLGNKERILSQKTVDDKNINSNLLRTWRDNQRTYFEIEMSEQYTVWFSDETLGRIEFVSYNRIENTDNYIVSFESIGFGTLHVGADSDQWALLRASNTLYILPRNVTESSSLVGGVSGGGNSNTSYMNFDGGSTYVSLGDNQKLTPSGQITISVWINGTYSGSSAGIISKCYDGANRAYYLNVGNTWGQRLMSAMSIGNVHDSLQPTSALIDNNLYNIVVTYTSGSHALYINGVFNNSVSTTGAMSTNNADLDIGKDPGCSNGIFNGRIYLVQIWNTSMNSSQVSQVYTSGKDIASNVSTSVLLYTNKMNSLTDISNSNKNGIAHNGVTLSNDYSYSFDGSDDKILLGNLGDVSTSTTTLWFKTDTVDSTSRILFAHTDGATTASSFVNISENKIDWWLGNTSHFYINPFTDTSGWHFLTLVRDTNNASIYYDGAIYNSTSSGYDLTSDSYLMISGKSYTGTSLPYDGFVGAIGIFNRTLSSTEIANLYSQGRMLDISTKQDLPVSDEESAKSAIIAGIVESKTGASYTPYYNQQIFERLLNGSQYNGTFDVFITSGNKRYAFNYDNASSNSFPQFYNITPVLYIWQKINMTSSDIQSNVKSFIDSTYS